MSESYADHVQRLRRERQADAYRLRSKGWSLRRIAELHGTSHPQVLRDVEAETGRQEAIRPTSEPEQPSGPSADAMLDAMGGPPPETSPAGGRAVPHPPGRKPAGWSGNLLDDPAQPGHDDMVNALMEGPR